MISVFQKLLQTVLILPCILKQLIFEYVRRARFRDFLEQRFGVTMAINYYQEITQYYSRNSLHQTSIELKFYRDFVKNVSLVPFCG